MDMKTADESRNEQERIVSRLLNNSDLLEAMNKPKKRKLRFGLIEKCVTMAKHSLESD